MPSTNIPPEAMMAALSAAAKTPVPGQDQASGAGAAPSANGAPAPDGGAPAADPNAPPDQGAGGSTTEQAVWQEFPATDPGQIEQLASSAQGAAPDELVQLLDSFMQQADADKAKLTQMHEAMMAHLVELLGAGGPTTPGQNPQGGQQIPAQGPGVGGQGTGY